MDDLIKKGSDIFNPQAKVMANVDRVIEFVETGNTAPVLIEVDPSNACNHACSFCLSSYIHFDKYKGTETFSRATMPRDMLMGLTEMIGDLEIIKEKEGNVLVTDDMYSDEVMTKVIDNLNIIVDDLDELEGISKEDLEEE